MGIGWLVPVLNLLGMGGGSVVVATGASVRAIPAGAPRVAATAGGASRVGAVAGGTGRVTAGATGSN